MDEVTILLPCFNGARFLNQQLESLADQGHLPSRLICSDDRSRDETVKIIENFAKTSPFPVDMIEGPAQGLGANTMRLLENAPDGQFIAFCDQDDLWFTHKINRAVQRLSDVDPNIPALFCSRSIITDSALNHIRTTQTLRSQPSFENALIQCLAPANTTILNPAAAALVKAAAQDCDLAPSLPDWWIYQLITGAGGHIIFEREPLLYYRQHDRNLIGACHGPKARLWRVFLLFNGTYRQWRLEQTRRLAASKHRLTRPSQQALNQILKGQLPQNSTRQSRAEQTLIQVAWQLGVA